MKTKLFILITILFTSISAYSQFVPNNIGELYKHNIEVLDNYIHYKGNKINEYIKDKKSDNLRKMYVYFTLEYDKAKKEIIKDTLFEQLDCLIYMYVIHSITNDNYEDIFNATYLYDLISVQKMRIALHNAQVGIKLDF